MDIELGTLYYLKLFVTDAVGEPVTGITVSYSIKQSIDDTIISTGDLTDSGNGMYSGSYIFTDLGQHYIIYDTQSGYTDEIEEINIINARATESDLLKVLGLVQHNFRITDQVYDVNGDLISASIKLYNSATDTENDIANFAEYEVEIAYQNRLVTNYKSKLV